MTEDELEESAKGLQGFAKGLSCPISALRHGSRGAAGAWSASPEVLSGASGIIWTVSFPVLCLESHGLRSKRQNKTRTLMSFGTIKNPSDNARLSDIQA